MQEERNGSMTTVCLIRHGETNWNAEGRLQGSTDIPLNEVGYQQAKETADYFEGSEWDLIVCSPLKRAKQTAEAINERLNLPLIEMEDIKERGFGDAEGLTIEERLAKYPDRNYPNKEQTDVFQKRIMGALRTLSENYPDKKILFVAHGGVIHEILSILSNHSEEIRNTKLINACISNIEFHDNIWEIKDFNQVSHLTHYNDRGRV